MNDTAITGQKLFARVEQWGFLPDFPRRHVLAETACGQDSSLRSPNPKHAEAVAKLLSRAMWDQETGRVWLESDGKEAE